MLCVVVLPSFRNAPTAKSATTIHVGEIHRRGDVSYNSHSPLSEPVLRTSEKVIPE